MDPTSIAILLYLLAVGLAFLDVFVPSGGMLLVLSVAAAAGCILFGFRAGMTMGMTMLTLVAASVPILAILAIKIWPTTPIGKRVVLGLPDNNLAKVESAQSPLDDFMGIVVACEYPLMPAGQLVIDRKRINALAESSYIEAGERVEVVGVRERNLIVRITTKPITERPNRSSKSALSEESASETTKNSSLLDVPAAELGLNSIDE